MRGERMTAAQRRVLAMAAAIPGTSMYLWSADKASGRALERRGLVTIETDSASRRQFVSVTPAGRRALEEADHG